MSNEYPRMLFKAGGPEQIHGGQFSTLIVHNDDEKSAALAAGWHLTTPEALEARQAELDEAARMAAAKLAEQGAAADSTQPPTRIELEQKATELGISFSAHLSNKKLSAAIAAKLAEQGA